MIHQPSRSNNQRRLYRPARITDIRLATVLALAIIWSCASSSPPVDPLMRQETTAAVRAAAFAVRASTPREISCFRLSFRRLRLSIYAEPALLRWETSAPFISTASIVDDRRGSGAGIMPSPSSRSPLLRPQNKRPRTTMTSLGASSLSAMLADEWGEDAAATAVNLPWSVRPLVIVLAGPTGVGKSAVAASLCHPSRASRLLSRRVVTYKDVGGDSGGGNRGGGRKGGKGGVGHVVSADSVQAYRGVHVGANKPTDEERKETPHHLIDVVDATERAYNAAEWVSDALYVVDRLLGRWGEGEGKGDDAKGEDDGAESEVMKTRREKIDEYIAEARSASNMTALDPVLPVVVGGTMMYLQWLVHGRPDAPQPSPEALERAAEAVADFQAMDGRDWEKSSDGEVAGQPSPGWDAATSHASGLGAPFKRMVDKLCGRDWYRLRRILEVAYTVLGEQGSTTTATTTATEERVDALYSGRRYGGIATRGYDVRCFFLCPDDRMGHAGAVDARCEDMLMRGLLRETANLSLDGRLPDDGQPARAIGYRQALDYLRRADARGDDAAALNAFVDEFAAATRRYAKKQMQWFRKDDTFAFVPVALSDPAQARVEAAADLILNTCLLPREAYEKEVASVEGVTDRGAKGKMIVKEGKSLTLSQRTKLANEEQGKGMKFFMAKRHKLVAGSDDFASLMEEADECTVRMQALSSLPT